MSELAERGLWLDDAAHREDLSTFVDRALRLDDAGGDPVAGTCGWSGGRLGAQRVSTCWPAGWWAAGCARRTCPPVPTRWPARCRGWTVRAIVDPGFAMDSAWRGVLPPETGFVHLDDVPARAVLDLAQRGVALAKEHSSAHGPPASLLDQEVVAVSVGRRRRSAFRCGAYSP